VYFCKGGEEQEQKTACSTSALIWQTLQGLLQSPRTLTELIMSGLFQFKFTKQNSPGAEQQRPGSLFPSTQGTSQSASLTMSDSVFRDYRDFIYRQSGIYFTESKKYLLEGRVAKRLSVNRLSSFEEYLEFLKSPRGKVELPSLYEAITINETYFFRSEQQFDAMEKILIPEMIKTKGNVLAPTIRIWSAAASSGEEAYTTSIIIQERIKPLFPNVRFQIIGTDINNAVLESARKGLYREYAIRNIPPPLLKKYFTKEGDLYKLSDEIKKNVSFMNLNLFDSNAMRMMNSFDLIFCCNVLIYFDLASKQQVVSSLYDALNKGGHLFIGYSESLHGVSKAFKLCHLPKAMVYKKE
jgi:chemotaxis protein methyltransferase CheR